MTNLINSNLLFWFSIILSIFIIVVNVWHYYTEKKLYRWISLIFAAFIILVNVLQYYIKTINSIHVDVILKAIPNVASTDSNSLCNFVTFSEFNHGKANMFFTFYNKKNNALLSLSNKYFEERCNGMEVSYKGEFDMDPSITDPITHITNKPVSLLKKETLYILITNMVSSVKLCKENKQVFLQVPSLCYNENKNIVGNDIKGKIINGEITLNINNKITQKINIPSQNIIDGCPIIIPIGSITSNSFIGMKPLGVVYREYMEAGSFHTIGGQTKLKNGTITVNLPNNLTYGPQPILQCR